MRERKRAERQQRVKDSSAFYDTGSVSPNSVAASIFEEDVPSPTLSLCRYFPAAGTMQATRIPVAELLQEALDDRNVHNSGRTRLDLCEAYLTPLAPDARLTLLRRFGPHIAVVLVGDASTMHRSTQTRHSSCLRHVQRAREATKASAKAMMRRRCFSGA